MASLFSLFTLSPEMLVKLANTFKAFPPSQESMSVQVGSVAEMISQQALNR